MFENHLGIFVIMNPIVEAINPAVIELELTAEKFVRNTNNGDREIYIIDAHDAPNTLQEIGRLRELSFRAAGGGTGFSTDIDEFDTMEVPFKQLIVWDPEDKAIVGGYRFLQGHKINVVHGHLHSPTAHLFEMTPLFNTKYLPRIIELGRSFVQPAYQPTVNMRKGMYSLDNLWDGLGVLTVDCPEIDYFFGKITMYPHLDAVARDLILYFIKFYFPDTESLLRPHKALPFKTDVSAFSSLFKGDNYQEDYKLLNTAVRERNENIPPLVNAYMNLSASMMSFGTANNDLFGDVEETGIMIKIADIYEKKKERHIQHINRIRNR